MLSIGKGDESTAAVFGVQQCTLLAQTLKIKKSSAAQIHDEGKPKGLIIAEKMDLDLI